MLQIWAGRRQLGPALCVCVCVHAGRQHACRSDHYCNYSWNYLSTCRKRPAPTDVGLGWILEPCVCCACVCMQEATKLITNPVRRGFWAFWACFCSFSRWILEPCVCCACAVRVLCVCVQWQGKSMNQCPTCHQYDLPKLRSVTPSPFAESANMELHTMSPDALKLLELTYYPNRVFELL